MASLNPAPYPSWTASNMVEPMAGSAPPPKKMQSLFGGKRKRRRTYKKKHRKSTRKGMRRKTARHAYLTKYLKKM